MIISRESRLPLSFAQNEVWIAHQLDSTNPRYNCGGYVEIQGRIDGALLAEAVRRVVEESESLRVRFVTDDDGPWQLVTQTDAPLHMLDVKGESNPRQTAETWMRSDLGRPVSLSEGPLFVNALLSIASDHHLLYFRYHHIVLDGFGQTLYWRRLAEVYTALEQRRLPSPTAFGALTDLLVEEDSYRQSPRFEAERSYWLSAMADEVERVSLVNGSPAPLSRNVLRRVLRQSPSNSARLAQAALTHQTHWSIIVIAATVAYLHRLTQVEDLVIGLPVRARTTRLSRTTPGMFANELPLRLTVLPTMSFAELVRHVSEQVSRLLSHQRYRGEELQRELRRRGRGGEPAGIVVNVVSFDDNLSFGGHPGTVHQLSTGPVRDLQIQFFGGADGAELQICFDANADLYDADALAAHQRRLAYFLNAVTEPDDHRPIGQVALLLPEESARLMGEFNATARPYDLSCCLHELFDAQANRTPTAIAVEWADGNLNYAELAEQSDRLAAHLSRLGVAPGQPVGVHDVRSWELVVSLLAVLKAGAAYLPLDPELPRSRLEFQVRDANVNVVLSRSTFAHQLERCAVDVVAVDTVLKGLPAADRGLARLATPESPAYVIYTSGSTGQPKGVVVPHRGVVNRLLWMQEQYGLGPEDSVLQKTPFTFDVSVWEFFWPLIVGGRLFLAEPGMQRDPRYLAAVIRERAITTIHFVPSMLDLFLAEPQARAGGRLRQVFCSGEALRPETVRAFFERYDPAAGGIKLHNLYGPTEASIDVTFCECGLGDAGGSVPIGRPVANTQIYMLDARRELMPLGAAGELYIGGVQVASGYLNRPELTAERFVANPFGPGTLYRTGDVARFRSDGMIEFLGRVDHQVKIRGHRIEPEEIESALLANPTVGQAAVIASERADGQQHLVAYVVPSGTTARLDELVAALRDQLPAYMIPAHVIVLDELPLLPNGKLDRNALPSPAQPLSESTADGAPPTTSDEELLHRVWCGVLGVARVDVDDSFFALGGDSMSAIKVRAEVERHGRTFAISELFEGPSIRQLAQVMRPLAGTGSQRTQPFQLVSPADRALLPIGIEDAYPLSAMQAGMLYHASYAERSSVYRVVTCVQVNADFDLRALRAAVADTARRHPSLRCSFDLTRYTEPLQLVHHEVVVPVDVADDLGELDVQARQQAMWDWVERAKFAQFDPRTPPLVRFTVHPCGPGCFQLSVVEHHVVLDGWSDIRMLEEVVDHYRARLSGQELWLPEIGSTYRDFVAAERQAAASDESREFWASRLRGAGPAALVSGGATGVEGTDAPEGPAIRRFEVPIPDERAKRLRRLAQQERLPLKALLTTAHLAVLRLVSGRDEVLTGVVANTRLEERGGDEVIGVFLNTLPLRLELGQSTLIATAHRVFAEETQSIPHRRYPFAQMQRDLGEDLPLDSYINFMDFHRKHHRSTNVGMQVGFGVAETNYPLAVNFLIDPERDQLMLWLDCDLARLAEEFCGRLVGYYQRALATLVDEPYAQVTSVDLLGHAERRLLARWNETATPFDAAATVHDLVERQVQTNPGATALVHRWCEVSYGEMDRRANQLAHHLRDIGVRRGDLVGVSLRRSTDLVVALLGVLKAGAAYLPLDPSFPSHRLENIAADAQITCLVTSRGSLEGINAPRMVDMWRERETLAARPATPVALEVSGEDVAYIMYTSGSSGQPKGTAVRHRNVVNFFVGMDQRVGCSPEDVALAVTSVSFDISVLELLWPLTHGAKVVLAGERLVDNLVPRAETTEQAVKFSLFFFAASAGGSNREGYRLVLDAARFADTHGFEAVWTPERHFHAFGGLYPNPSVMAAALATITEQVSLRCGSVVAPLHDSVRIAEEWSLVDNLSNGRVGLAFASGWNSNDFVFFPDNYPVRKQRMAEQLAEFRHLWRGEPVSRVGGSGQQVEVRIFPAPVQSEPPIWLTSVGTLQTFQQAGATGANLLTHLLGQNPDDLTEKIKAYRKAREEHGHAGPGQVTVMVHTFMSNDAEQAKQRARGPFREYLRSSTELWRTLFAATGQEFPETGVEEHLDAVVDLAIERYFETSGLFGSPETCADLVRLLARAGVDEIACLIDFGVQTADALNSLTWLDRLREAHEEEVAESQHSLAELCRRHGVTLVQGTPSLMSAVVAEPVALESLSNIRVLLVGGEAFPAGLAQRLLSALPKVRVLNMYGPTETTIWSTTYELNHDRDAYADAIPIGRPIANTEVRVVDDHGQPVPVGVAGELWIGGDGVAAGYIDRPERTTERFVDHPEGRFYRTGDRVRWRTDGNLDFLGRMDRQVKILGHRVEPDEVENVLSRHPEVDAVAVVAQSGPSGVELVAYVSPSESVVDPAMQDTHVRRWREVWEETYRPNGGQPAHPEFAGWNSSITGKPIPEAEMREWLGHTVDRVRALRPRAVADIGVGVGLLLRELAEQTEQYHGVDISAAALASAAVCLGTGRDLPAHVRLEQSGPEYLSGLPPRSLDTVILNSVVQYFPGLDYLRQVLSDAVRVVRPGGAVFVGDVRAVEMLPEFHTAVQLYRAPQLQTIEEISAAVARQVQDEHELCLSPTFFRRLSLELPEIGDVRVELKRGRADNELTLFRYDVTLLIGRHAPPTPTLTRLDWNSLSHSLAGLRHRLATCPGPLLVTRVPNRPLARPVAAARMLTKIDGRLTAWDLERLLWDVDDTTGAHPEDLIDVASESGRQVRLLVPSDGRLDHFDAAFDNHQE